MTSQDFRPLIAANDLSARLLGVMLLILGMIMAAAGVWIMLLSGYVYHLYSGLGVLASGALLIRYRRLGKLVLFIVLTLSVLSALMVFQQDLLVLITSLVIPNGFMLLLIIMAPYLTKRHFGREADPAKQQTCSGVIEH